MADDGECVMNGEWSFLFWTIFLPYPSSNIHILIFLLVGVVWRLGWIVIGVVEQYCDVSHTVACGGGVNHTVGAGYCGAGEEVKCNQLSDNAPHHPPQIDQLKSKEQ